jgi:hypothetical protein
VVFGAGNGEVPHPARDDFGSVPASGYMDAWAGEGDDSDERIPLCRIEYLGDDTDWGFAIYDPGTESYTDAILATGHRTGHPNDAYDTAALVHLADYKK